MREPSRRATCLVRRDGAGGELDDAPWPRSRGQIAAHAQRGPDHRRRAEPDDAPGHAQTVSLDPARLLADARSHAVSDTSGPGAGRALPNDLIVSFAPTLTTHYLGRTDFWLRTEGYAKYVWAGKTPLRDVHTEPSCSAARPTSTSC